MVAARLTKFRGSTRIKFICAVSRFVERYPNATSFQSLIHDRGDVTDIGEFMRDGDVGHGDDLTHALIEWTERRFIDADAIVINALGVDEFGDEDYIGRLDLNHNAMGGLCPRSN